MAKMREKLKSYIQKRQAMNQAKLRKDFLPEALEIIEKPVSPIGHFAIITTVAIIAFFLVWSIVGKMDEVATARGRISTVNGIQEIQSLKGGMIKQICVNEGDKVKAGQAIILLDSSVDKITIQNTTENIELLTLENSLLEKIKNNEDIESGFIKDKEPRHLEIVEYVTSMQTEFRSQKEEGEIKSSQAKSQIEIEEENLKRLENNKNFLNTQKEELLNISEKSGPEKQAMDKIAALIERKEKELLDYWELYIGGAISKAEYEELEGAVEQLNREYNIQEIRGFYENYDNRSRLHEIENQLAGVEKDCENQKKIMLQATQTYEQALKQLSGLEAKFVTGVANLIIENENTINTQKANLDIQIINFSDQTLASPVNGTVKTLDVDTVNGILAPAQVAATIVPDGAQILAEVDILNKDIGYIKIGQPVAIKLDTFGFQKYGKLKGTIVSVRPDAVLDERKGWIYIAKASVDVVEFRNRHPDIDIGVGMECTAEVKINERRIIEFFLEPIIEHFDGSLKVR